jgi:hypothetical protein
LSKDNKTIVIVSGGLSEGDAGRFKDLLKKSSAAGKPVSAVRLNSPGGSLIEGVRLAGVIQGENIRGSKIATVVAAGATCAGACFIPFVAGHQKFVSATATVAVPGAKSERQPAGNARECDRNCPPAALVQSEKPALVQVVQKLGLLDAIVTKMLATPEDQVFMLTRDDLRAMGATMTKPSPPSATKPAPRPSFLLGGSGSG